MKKAKIQSFKQEFNPELLLPVGSPEAFHAAIAGGANAIYLGFNVFNARSRAKNFNPKQLASIVKMAHLQGVKCYITLNTVIRNSELSTLADTLWMLQQIKPDAVIVQDFGVLFLIKRFFPMLKVHASTQMGIHNSAGVNFAHQQGIERVVLAREITLPELELISKRSQAELELFVHGALCYSFSGMCLFSSYIGGASANRGLCSQPCRRIYTQNKSDNYFFSLKDNQLVEHIPFLKKLGIHSLKIEGRIKSADYVYQTATAYRKALDQFNQMPEALELLRNDFGREKTGYFLGRDVAQAITQKASAGLIIGHILQFQQGVAQFKSEEKLPASCRLRFRNHQTDEQFSVSVSNLKEENKIYSFKTDNQSLKVGFEVYQAGQNKNFTSKIDTEGIKINLEYPNSLLKKLFASVGSKKVSAQQKRYVRIDNPLWLNQLKASAFEIILAYDYQEFKRLAEDKQSKILSWKNIHIELPQFIAEKSLPKYRTLINQLTERGVTSFFISQLYQKQLLPTTVKCISTENIYLFNDAAIQAIRSEKITDFIYPLENDIVNLGKTSDRSGIVPIFYLPKLFYSRMPIKATKEQTFADKSGQKYRKLVKDGMTIVLPEKAVSLTQYVSKLDRYGYKKYLLDLSFIDPSKAMLDQILQAIDESKSVPFASTAFNFKRELK